MSSTAPPAYQPEKPRFTVRGLMITTAVVAVYAAIGGAICRRLDPTDQASLLVFWTATALAIPAAWYYALRREAKLYGNDSAVRYVVPALGPGPVRSRPSQHRRLLTIVLIGMSLAYWSFLVVNNLRVIRHINWGWFDLFACSMLPIGAYAIAHRVVQLILRRNQTLVAICDDGLRYYRLPIPWKHVHEVRWLADDPGTLFLHRYDGDIYLRPAADQRDAVEAFIRERTGLPCEPAPAPKEPA